MEGIVYILTNQAMPGFIKIGKTENDLAGRIRTLSSSTAVPFEFECYYAARVADCHAAERAIHDAFADHRPNPRREFFELDPERAKSAIRWGAIEEVTPSLEEVVPDAAERAAIDNMASRRRKTTLADLGIQPGETLVLDRDPNSTCEVIDRLRVRFRGDVTSLSAAALAALHALGYDWPAANGWAHWTWRGRPLRDHVTDFLAE